MLSKDESEAGVSESWIGWLRSWDDKNGSQCTCNVNREKYWNGSFYHKFISFCYIGLIILLLLTSSVIYVNLIIFLHRCITRLHASGPCKDFRKFSIFGFQSNLDTINATLLITLPSIFFFLFTCLLTPLENTNWRTSDSSQSMLVMGVASSDCLYSNLFWYIHDSSLRHQQALRINANRFFSVKCWIWRI